MDGKGNRSSIQQPNISAVALQVKRMSPLFRRWLLRDAPLLASIAS
jgi:hypothetical protein